MFLQLRLKEHRQRLGITQQKVAEALVQLAWERKHKEVGVTADMVSKWERGERHPNPLYSSLLAELYGVTEAQLGLCPLLPVPSEDAYAEIVVPIFTPDGRVEFVPLDRRTFLLGAGAAALSGPVSAFGLWQGGQLLSDVGSNRDSPVLRSKTGQLDMAHVRQLKDTLEHLWHLDDQFGGDRLWGLAAGTFHQIGRLIQEGTYTETVGRELHVIAAKFAEHSGWLCFDADRQEESRWFYHEALRLSTLADDEKSTVLILAGMSVQSTTLGRPREAVTLARRAQAIAEPWATPRLMSWLACREARGLATMGDTADCEQTISRAWRQFEQGKHDNDPTWLAFYNEAVLCDSEARCRADQGQYDRAEVLLRQGLAVQTSAYPRNICISKASLARTLLARREVEQACAVAGQSMVMLSDVSSTRTVNVLRRFRTHLTPYLDVPAARHFLDQSSTVLT